MHPDWTFVSTHKVSALSHRALSSDQTLGRLRNCARRVPISRVSDLTPLDRLRLPVFSATTPLARDLTTHLGKGLDAESAQVSAMMEAVERISAEQVDRSILRLSYQDLVKSGDAVIDPRDCDLPDDSRYAEDRPISWIQGWEFVSQQLAWIPLDLAITPPQEGVLLEVDTNGLAAGNSLIEAVVHGLCEVIERDALSVSLFRSTFGDGSDAIPERRRISPDSVPRAGREWVERISANGLRIETEHLDSDIGVPVFRSVIIDHQYPSADGENTRKFIGLGASPNAAIAATRSITEAVQSRIALVQGARDSFNTLSPDWRRSTGASHRQDVAERMRVSLDTVPTFETDDLLEDLEYLISRLRRAGFKRVLAIDLTRGDFEIPVVRVRVPGLASFAVNRARPGWRCLRYLL